WVRDAIFYQVFPDRFARAGRFNKEVKFEEWESAPTVAGFKGGDLYGLADRLPYLEDLGITAIYLNPVFSSASNHRYHTYDYFQVDPLLGGNHALENLLQEAHQRGMKIVLDGVFNHSGRGLWQFHHVMETGGASPYRDWFLFDPERLNGNRPFLPYPDDATARALKDGAGSFDAVGYSAWWNLPALPKFNIKCPAVREFLLSVGEHWVRFGIDGWRLDVPNEIDDDDFWREFRHRVRQINPRTYIVGEVWGEAKRWLKGDMWDAVMNYQVTAACLGFFGRETLETEEVRKLYSFKHVGPVSAQEFDAEIRRVSELYSDEINQCQLNLLDSHDMPRFLTCVGDDVSALKLAWLMLCTLPGAPCVYYGDEIGLQGGHDPDCRRAFPWDSSHWNHDLLNWYRQCIALRKRHPALRHGERRTLLASDEILAYAHQAVGDCVVVVFNCSDQPQRVRIQDHELVCHAEHWIQWLSNCEVDRDAEGDSLHVSVPARSACVLSVGSAIA
ncbi:MAG: DUF3459 domain-containing protein, partial [Planctomycetaceae bacterium]|nr:DUF3459 domain-containing protein [Planctomycetaceae bacterium]